MYLVRCQIVAYLYSGPDPPPSSSVTHNLMMSKPRLLLWVMSLIVRWFSVTADCVYGSVAHCGSFLREARSLLQVKLSLLGRTPTNSVNGSRKQPSWRVIVSVSYPMQRWICAAVLWDGFVSWFECVQPSAAAPRRPLASSSSHSQVFPSAGVGSPVNIRDNWIYSAVQLTSLALKCSKSLFCFVFFLWT